MLYLYIYQLKCIHCLQLVTATCLVQEHTPPPPHSPLYRAEMVRKLEGSFKGLKFIGSLRETLRGGKRKASWSDTDTSELIRFSKVGIPGI